MANKRRDTEDVSRKYFREVSKYPPLSREEEYRLAIRVREGDEEAKKKMILSNLRLVISIAKSYTNHSVPFLDLIEEGNMGLIKAVDRFDPERGFRFSTYSSWWIKQYISRAVANYSRTLKIPIHIFKLMIKYFDLEGLTAREKRAELGISERRFKTLEQLIKNIRALDLSNTIDKYNQLADNVKAEESIDAEQIILNQIEHEELSELIKRLSDREQFILKIRYGFSDGAPHTLADIGGRMNVSRERVRQLEKRALRKLKAILDAQRDT
ncbi:MAG: RNA polymerase sigma factor RpoD/SigA [Candidatus Krumholzibacteriales bacterium]